MRILIVDDDAMSRGAVASFLSEDLGHEVVECDRGERALEIFAENPFPAVISDVKMPGIDGIELLHKIRKTRSPDQTCFVLMTGFGDMETAIQALRAGACDFLLKPLNIEELAVVLSRIEETIRRADGALAGGPDGADRAAGAGQRMSGDPGGIPGASAFVDVPEVGRVGLYSDAMRAASSMAQNLHSYRTVPVLIEGETGTGKEIMARMVHHGSGDHKVGPFVTVNCSAITPTLFESELFGYEKGAFTGASGSGKAGKLEQAQGGTLFLDEIGDLPPDLQPKLLRVLQQREMYRVGSVQKIRLDVRLIGATNKELEAMVSAGGFRQDLYYRLNVGRIFVPPLRDRPEDILPLAQMFLKKFSERHGRRFRFIGAEARKALRRHDWPGNVRELENTIERLTLLHDDEELKPEYLSIGDVGPLQAVGNGAALDPGKIVLPPDSLDLELLEQEIVRKALRKFDGNKSKAAAYLGLSRGAFYTRLRRQGK